MRKLLGLLVVCVTVLATLPLPAEAASPIRFSRIYFDSPGSDTGSNTSLNGEWFELKNYGTRTKNLYGWKVRDGYGFTYKFGTYYLKPGYRVHVHTGRGTNSGRHRYWGRTWYVWNNSGDVGKLYNRAGTRVDTCRFSGAGDVTYC